MRAIYMAICGVAFSACGAFAADMPLKAPRAGFDAYPYNGSGFYYGLGTFAEAQKVNAPAVVAVGSTYAAGAAVSMVAGWQWSFGATKWAAVEGSLNYANTGASPACANPCVINARYSATQKFKFGGPIAAMLSLLPDLGTVFPVLPPLNQPNPLTHPYIMAVLHQDRDVVSGSRGVRVRGGAGLGLLTQIKDGMVMDVWTEYTFAAGASVGSVGFGPAARVGASVLY